MASVPVSIYPRASRHATDIVVYVPDDCMTELHYYYRNARARGLNPRDARTHALVWTIARVIHR